MITLSGSLTVLYTKCHQFTSAMLTLHLLKHFLISFKYSQWGAHTLKG